ncbi:Uncharacterised protein [uncultured archaeon]|nr:Uncharacterised protein [uncultured archaeon]
MMAKQPSEKDVENKINLIEKKLEDLKKLHENADKINFSDIDSKINKAIEARDEAKISKNYDDANKKAEEALRAVKKEEEAIIDGVRICQFLTWKEGLMWEMILAIIAAVVMYFLIKTQKPEIPIAVFLWAILGAIAYLIFGIAYHYRRRELTNEELLFLTARMIQAPILAGAIYLVLTDLNSTQQLIVSINQTLQTENMTPITITNQTLMQKPSNNILMVVSFFTGFFTEPAVAFLRTLAKKLLPESPKT